MTMSNDPTQRFSDRVADYVAYRPSYPLGVRDVLVDAMKLTPDWRVADLGSGPGALARLFLDYGCAVWGVEPNKEMREAGEDLLHAYPRYTSINGRAESTELAAGSIDLVVAGQAFHWFDRAAARAECLRVVKEPRRATLVWNDRRLDASPFLVAYEGLLRRYGTDYAAVNNKDTVDKAALAAFFGPEGYEEARLDNVQMFDGAGLRGRLLSSSYAPRAGRPGHDEMLEALQDIFDVYQTNGAVSFEYDTRVYYGRLS